MMLISIYLSIYNKDSKQTNLYPLLHLLFCQEAKNILFLAIWNVLYVIHYGHHVL